MDGFLARPSWLSPSLNEVDAELAKENVRKENWMGSIEI